MIFKSAKIYQCSLQPYTVITPWLQCICLTIRRVFIQTAVEQHGVDSIVVFKLPSGVFLISVKLASFRFSLLYQVMWRKKKAFALCMFWVYRRIAMKQNRKQYEIMFLLLCTSHWTTRTYKYGFVYGFVQLHKLPSSSGFIAGFSVKNRKSVFYSSNYAVMTWFQDSAVNNF